MSFTLIECTLVDFHVDLFLMFTQMFEGMCGHVLVPRRAGKVLEICL